MAVLLVTNHLDYETDLIVFELRQRGVDYFRLNVEDFPTQVQVAWSLTDRAGSYFERAEKRIFLGDIQGAWCRHAVDPVISAEIADPVARQFALNEARVALSGILCTLDCLWISRPDKIAAASIKLTQLEVARQVGFHIPETLVTTAPDRARSFLSQRPYPVVFKPLGSGTLCGPTGHKQVLTTRIEPEHWDSLAQVAYAPTQFQQLIEKTADVRVAVVGQQVFAAEIESQSSPGTRTDMKRGVVANLPHRVVRLPSEVESKCVQVVARLGLEYGAIDLVPTAQREYYFLEVNPDGQWAWIELLTGLPITSAIVDRLTRGREQPLPNTNPREIPLPGMPEYGKV